MSNYFVIGAIFDEIQSPKFCVSGLKSHRDCASGCTEPRAFLRLLSGRSDTVDGLKWAAPGKNIEHHVMVNPKRLARRGPAWNGRAARPLNDSLNGDVGTQGRACGVHQPLSKSSGFDKESLGISSTDNRKPGVSPNPCISRPIIF